MFSAAARKILELLKSKIAMDGPDIEDATGLDEKTIKAAAIELRSARLITTSGAPDGNEDDGNGDRPVDDHSVGHIGLSAHIRREHWCVALFMAGVQTLTSDRSAD